MQTVKSWQLEPQRALDAHALSTPRPRLLRPRPDRWGDSEPLLLAALGQLELQEEVPYGSPERMQLEPHRPAQRTAAWSSGLTRSRQQLRRGMRRQRTSLSGCVRFLAAATSQCRCGSLLGVSTARTPASSSMGCRTSTAERVLRKPFWTVLAPQGHVRCSRRLRDLPGPLAVGTHGVSNGNACLAYIQTPDEDRHLGRFPKRFSIDGDTRTYITRPWQLRQPSQPSSFQSQHSAPERRAARVLDRSVSRSAHGAQARKRTAAAAQPTQPAPSSKVQQLEARVQASRAPSTHAIGYLGKPGLVGARIALPQEDSAIPKRRASTKAYHRKATPSNEHVPSTRGYPRPQRCTPARRQRNTP